MNALDDNEKEDTFLSLISSYEMDDSRGYFNNSFLFLGKQMFQILPRLLQLVRRSAKL